MSSYYFLNDFWRFQKENFDKFYFSTDLWQCQKENFDSQRRRNQQRVEDVVPASCRWETQQYKCRAFEGAEIHQWSEGPCQFDVGEEKHPKYGVDEEAEHEKGHDVDDSRQGDDQGEHHFAQAFGHLSLKLTPIYHLVRLPVTATHTSLLPAQATSHHNSRLSITGSGHLSLQLVRPPVTTAHTYLSPGQATCHHNSHLSITGSGHLSPQLTPIYHLVFGLRRKKNLITNYKQHLVVWVKDGKELITLTYKHHLVFWVNDLVLVPAFTSNF